jgi:hypothetical protein
MPNRLTPWDYALLVKGATRTALALYGVTHTQLARLLGLESTARVDAALSDARDNAIPLWWFAHPAFPAQVRAHVFEELTRRCETAPTSAETPEHQLMVALSKVGGFVTVAAATMLDHRVSADDAAQLLRVIEGATTALASLGARLRRRVDTGRHPAARGAQS